MSINTSIKDIIKERIDISEQQVCDLEIYLRELWNWNKKINLVGVSSIERVVEELLLDSLMAKEFIPEQATLLDIGSGAGFPSIPLKIIRQKAIFHLVESRSKKAAFLRYIIREMKLKNIKVIEGRIEDNFKPLLDEYDVIIFRGIKLSSGLSYAIPYLKNGIIISFQGADFSMSLNKVENLMKKNRLKLIKIKQYIISKRNRALLLFKKI